MKQNYQSHPTQWNSEAALTIREEGKRFSGTGLLTIILISWFVLNYTLYTHFLVALQITEITQYKTKVEWTTAWYSPIIYKIQRFRSSLQGTSSGFAVLQFNAKIYQNSTSNPYVGNIWRSLNMVHLSSQTKNRNADLKVSESQSTMQWSSIDGGKTEHSATLDLAEKTDHLQPTTTNKDILGVVFF